MSIPVSHFTPDIFFPDILTLQACTLENVNSFLPDGASSKESAWQCKRHKRCGFHPWGLGRSPREISSLLFLPGESHGQRSLAGYGPWGLRVGYD